MSFLIYRFTCYYRIATLWTSFLIELFFQSPFVSTWWGDLNGVPVFHQLLLQSLGISDCYRNVNDALFWARKVFHVYMPVYMRRDSGHRNSPICMKFNSNINVFCTIICSIFNVQSRNSAFTGMHKSTLRPMEGISLNSCLLVCDLITIAGMVQFEWNFTKC